MPNFYLKDDTGFKYKVGDTSGGFNRLPIYNTLKVFQFDLMSGGSINILSHQTADIYQTAYVQYSEHGDLYPVCIVGVDVSMAYYCNIAKFYMDYNDDGTAKVYVRIANTGSSTYTINRLYAHVLYALRTNDDYMTTKFGSIDGGVM